MKIFALTPIGCQVRGGELRPFLQRISDEHPHGSYTPDGIMMKFMSGEWVAWVIGDHEEDVQAVAASCSYHDMMGLQVARVLFLVGNTGGPNEMRNIMAQFERLCTEAGISSLETIGRKGLSRVLTDFSDQYVVLRKRLDTTNYPQYVVRPEDILPNTELVGRA